MLRLIKETPAWLCYGVCLNLQSWKWVTSRTLPRTHSSSALVLPIILSLVFEDDPCGIVAVPSRAARTLRVDEVPSHVSQCSGRRLRRGGSLRHWSTCWQSSSLCTFTAWTASTFPPREQVQIVTIQVFMSCFFPDHFTQCIVPAFRVVWTLSRSYIILWICVQVLKAILKIMCKGPVMVRRGPEVGAWCIWGSRGRPVFGAEQSVGRARNTLTDHLLTDLCPHSEHQQSLLEVFPFVLSDLTLKIIFRI